MAREFRSDCVGCGLPCLHEGCKYYSVPYLICDGCGNENCEELYIVDGEELCEECALERLPKSTIDDMLWGEDI